uniref:Putative secreted peptide n=1 Tax=Anopheles braziliensis TaxID=58242 RepID=A0A2M3ZNQ9_9DIPT
MFHLDAAAAAAAAAMTNALCGCLVGIHFVTWTSAHTIEREHCCLYLAYTKHQNRTLHLKALTALSICNASF